MKKRQIPEELRGLEVKESTDDKGERVQVVKMPMCFRTMKADVVRRDPAPPDPAEEATEDDEGEEDTFTTYEISVTSETPVEEYVPGIGWAMVTLGHSSGEVDLSRMKDGAAWRDTHWGDQVGVSDDAIIRDGKVWTIGRFSKNERAQEIERDWNDGIRRNVSGGFLPAEYVVTRMAEGQLPEVRCVGWEMFHMAFVPDGADPTVGARGKESHESAPVIIRGGTAAREGEAMKKFVLGDSGELLEVSGDDPRAALSDTQVRGMRAAAPAPRVEVADPPAPKMTRKQEIAEIRSACKEYGLTDTDAADIIQSDVDMAGARAEILVRVGKSRALTQPPAESLEEMGLSEKDAKRYSFCRSIAQAAGLLPKDGLEWEVTKAIRAKMPSSFQYSGGSMIPYRRRKQPLGRALDPDTKGQGAELVAMGQVEFVDYLRNAVVISRLGGTFLTGLTAPVTFAKKTGINTISWYGLGKAITETDQKFIPLALEPKRLGGYERVDRELLVTASLDAESMVINDLRDGTAVAFDLAGLLGNGNAQPTGIWNIPTIQSQPMGGTLPTFKLIAQSAGKVRRKNALPPFGWVTTPEMASTLQASPKVAGGGSTGFIWEGPNENGLMNGYRSIDSSQLTGTKGAGSDEHEMIFGPWRYMIMGQFGPGFEVIVDPYSNAEFNLVRYIINMLGDVICIYPEAFIKATGAKLA